MLNPSNPKDVAEGRGHWFFWALAMVWVLFVFAWYFSVTHLGRYLPMVWRVFDASNFPPANLEQKSQVWGESLRILLTVAVISGVTWSLGRKLRVWLGLQIADPWVRLGFNYGFGLIAFNLFWVGTGLLGLWYKPLWLTVAVLCVFFLTLDIIQLIKERKIHSLGSFFPREPAYLFLFLAGCFYWVFSLLMDLAPESFYDSMVYHLAVPSDWLLRHGIRDYATNFFANYPYGAECYFLSGLALQGTESAKMLHVVSFGVCALLAGGWARQLAGQGAGAGLGLRELRPLPQHSQSSLLGLRASGQAVGWLALGFTLTLPLFVVNTWATQVEGFLALLILLFLYASYQFINLEKGSAIWTLTAGLFAGYAFATKYTAFLIAGGALLVLIVKHPSVYKKKYWGHWIVLASGSVLLFGPWVLKNLAYTGNPCFPYLMSLFPGRHLTQGGYAQLLIEQHARVTEHWWEWLLLPWTLTMSTPNSYNFCGPFALAFMPLCFLFKIRQPILKMLTWLTPLLLVVGLLITHILRFIVPDFVLFFILLSALLSGGDRPIWGKVTAWTAGLCALLCFVNLAGMASFNYSSGGLWAGKQTRAQYLSGGPGKLNPYYSMAQWIGEKLPSDARLLVVGDARGLYYDRPFLTNSVFDEQVLARIARQAESAEGIARRLKEMGVDYLVINGLEGMRVSAEYDHYDLNPEEWAKLDEFVQRGTEALYDQNLQEVHRILPLFKDRPDRDRPDLLLFFSKQGTQYVRDAQGRKVDETRKDLEGILKLYPFSRFWKRQKLDFEKSVKALSAS